VHSNNQLVQMQFELVSLWREMEEQDSANIPNASGQPGSHARKRSRGGGVALSSLQLNPSMAEYLGLTPFQIDAIHPNCCSKPSILSPPPARDHRSAAMAPA